MSQPPVLGRQARLTVRTLSDWHVGTGHGIPGDVHAVVRRDAEGLPYLPGTTLTGVLREACRVMALALDDGAPDGVWLRWHRVLFGDRPDEPGPRATRTLRPAAVGISAARVSPGLRASIAADPRLLTATTVRRPGVAIDVDTGRAEDDMLRLVEVARGGLPLHGKVDLEPPLGSEDGQIAFTALLVLGAAWCEQIGGGRRRGLGRVELRLDEQDGARWAQWLDESGWQPPEPPVTAPVLPPDAVAEALRAVDRWQCVELDLLTVSPIRVPGQVTGNLVRGLDFVPGSLLLPLLSQRWGPDLVGPAIRDSTLLVRHALPVINNERALPSPLTMYRSRDDESLLFLHSPPAHSRQVRGHYTLDHTEDGHAVLRRGALARVSHNTVDVDSQRPDSAGGIYELEVIPAGTRLRARVLVDEELAGRLRARHGDTPETLLEGPTRLGARRRGEYGDVVVTARRAQAMPTTARAPQSCTVWAVSDLLVRGPSLRLSARPQDLRDAVAASLGVPVEVDITMRTARRDGWQGRWQLPRPSLVGIAAGSVVRLRFPSGPPAPAAWSRLLNLGIGDRRAEGYGELLADPPLLGCPTATALDLLPTPEIQRDLEGTALSPQEQLALSALQTAVTAEQITDALPAGRDTAEYRELRHAMADLSPSQRGTWRAVTLSAAVDGDIGRLHRHAATEASSDLPRRTPQRTAARVMAALAGKDATGPLRPWRLVLDDLGCTVDSAGQQAIALAALIADVLDGLRRGEEHDDRLDHSASRP